MRRDGHSSATVDDLPCAFASAPPSSIAVHSESPDLLLHLYDLHDRIGTLTTSLAAHYYIMSILSQSFEASPRARNSSPSPSSGKNSHPFPAQPALEGGDSWDVSPETRHIPRTVRRKKSSFDLRDVFKNGGVLPSHNPVPVA